MPMDLHAILDTLRQWFLYDPDRPLVFTTGMFLGFFVVFLGLYLFVADRKSVRVIYITLFSLFFYYKSSGMFFILLLVSSLLDYIIGYLIYVYREDVGIVYRRVSILPKFTLNVVDLQGHVGYHESESGKVTLGIEGPLRPIYLFIRTFLFFLLELVLTLIDRFANRMTRGKSLLKKRKFLLVTSVIANLGILAYFKYTNFFIDTFNALVDNPMDPVNIFLPVGISFFTFQTMSYTIDIYREKLNPVVNIMDFAFYVSFFPQLVAGPIVRASDFIPQIRSNIQVSAEDIGRGWMLILAGLFKKAVISDYIGVNFVDRVFESPMLYSGFENLMGVYAYAIQIYCDFSGYTDIAIGIALLMGFRLPINFRTPYKSASIQEFWRNWHISLSSWLRDYLYISLGGNRKGKVRTYVNLILTMVLGGLWHGASWRFVVWGTLHGLALALDRMTKGFKEWVKQKISGAFDRLDEMEVKSGSVLDPNTKWGQRLTQFRWSMQGWLPLVLSVGNRLLGVFFTFHFVCFCWIFFRAESFASAMDVIHQITHNLSFDVAAEVLIGYRRVFLLTMLGFILHFLPSDVDQFVEKKFIQAPLIWKSVAVTVVLYLVMQTQTSEVQPFIYFQF
ncbi:MBOAT family O-acyltransferase [Pontibacter sp. G13]|uniref:MBOAT family O-acyltransferase n=1 Tax=Pontibacter sp. G13 TaxID=3074898 RepID=UPI002889B3BB|nr:MBOAT family O-acyltransferase [Pontibacter sp. G13]WNJ17223.1 MBOAT family O-acyltransferase [Pontibacter sp. G13]